MGEGEGDTERCQQRWSFEQAKMKTMEAKRNFHIRTPMSELKMFIITKQKDYYYPPNPGTAREPTGGRSRATRNIILMQLRGVTTCSNLFAFIWYGTTLRLAHRLLSYYRMKATVSPSRPQPPLVAQRNIGSSTEPTWPMSPILLESPSAVLVDRPIFFNGIFPLYFSSLPGLTGVVSG
jgi:hypothetical protein